MKYIKHLGMLLCIFLCITSCSDDKEISGIVHFELVKGESLINPLHEPFKDPGLVVTYMGEDVTKDVKIEGEVDANTVGMYYLTYTYTNKDGVNNSRTRTVIVADPNVTLDISGKYVTGEGTYRLSQKGKTEFKGQEIVISKIAPGFFFISDLLGGYYDQFVGYGPQYVSGGYVQLTNDGTITLLSSTPSPWGDAAEPVKFEKYNPELGSVNFDTSFAQMNFIVKLHK